LEFRAPPQKAIAADPCNALAAITSLNLSSRSHEKMFARAREIVVTGHSLEAKTHWRTRKLASRELCKKELEHELACTHRADRGSAFSAHAANFALAGCSAII
jgi:hypothetical protein